MNLSNEHPDPLPNAGFSNPYGVQPAEKKTHSAADDGAALIESGVDLITPEVIFETWAPHGSIWSAWAKPVLFLQMTESMSSERYNVHDPALIERLRQQVPELIGRSGGRRTALVFDLPGASSIFAGLEAARHGFRPVPMFNCTTGPGADVIPIRSLVESLRMAGAALRAMRLSDASPPAFLIDSDRLGGPDSIVPKPLTFDNRWIVFPQDFPSGLYLRRQGIDSVLVIRSAGSSVPLHDLNAVMQGWIQDGVQVLLTHVDVVSNSSGKALVETVEREGWMSRMFTTLRLVFHGIRRNYSGGFGRAIPLPPEPGTGGYFG
ncbi:MAG: hypothetical protein IBJ18_10930 [Phycisphaerales bacterium]|nr:hypothetical protein [Phycisphaerales bacterium]